MTILHQIGEALRTALSQIPLWMVRGLFLVTLLVLLVWVIRLPRSAGREHAGSGWSSDLRLWAAVALLIQIVIYSIF